MSKTDVASSETQSASSETEPTFEPTSTTSDSIVNGNADVTSLGKKGINFMI